MAGRRDTNEWWVKIAHAFETHVREETRFLAAYEELCQGVDDPGTRFLVELILEDERRHHGIFERLASSARGDDGIGVLSPPAPHPSPAEARAILAPTREFLEAELEDRRHLRTLAKEVDGVADSLWRLLIELMDLDTRKHVMILEFLRDRLTESAAEG
ncbi:MAG TPA: hypothetical protein VIR58_12880 [Acidimicrobiales bacterium]